MKRPNRGASDAEMQRLSLVASLAAGNGSLSDLDALRADGSDWLRRLCEEWFPNAERIVDFFHAAEYLWAAARGRHRDDAKAAKRWAEKLCRMLEAARRGRR